MDIINIVNSIRPNTISRLANKAEDFHGEDSIPFMGKHVQLFDGATLPSEDSVSEYEATYNAGILTQQLKAALASHRYDICNGGTTLNGIAIQTDETSRSNLTAAFVMASANPAYSVHWKTPNGFVTLNAATIIALGGVVSAFVQKCYSTEATLIESITDYPTPEAICAAFDALMVA